MAALGFERFAVVGHDRGARCAYRMALDHPERVERAGGARHHPHRRDVPAHATCGSRSGAWHWFFLAQPYDLPERLIAADPEGFYFADAARAVRAGGARRVPALPARPARDPRDLRGLPRRRDVRLRARRGRSRHAPDRLPDARAVGRDGRASAATTCSRSGRRWATRRARRSAAVRPLPPRGGARTRPSRRCASSCADIIRRAMADDAAIRARADELIAGMTTAEKAGQLSQYFYFGALQETEASVGGLPSEPATVEAALGARRGGVAAVRHRPGARSTASSGSRSRATGTASPRCSAST